MKNAERSTAFARACVAQGEARVGVDRPLVWMSHQPEKSVQLNVRFPFDKVKSETISKICNNTVFTLTHDDDSSHVRQLHFTGDAKEATHRMVDETDAEFPPQVAASKLNPQASGWRRQKDDPDGPLVCFIFVYHGGKALKGNRIATHVVFQNSHDANASTWLSTSERTLQHPADDLFVRVNKKDGVFRRCEKDGPYTNGNFGAESGPATNPGFGGFGAEPARAGGFGGFGAAPASSPAAGATPAPAERSTDPISQRKVQRMAKARDDMSPGSAQAVLNGGVSTPQLANAEDEQLCELRDSSAPNSQLKRRLEHPAPPPVTPRPNGYISSVFPSRKKRLVGS